MKGKLQTKNLKVNTVKPPASGHSWDQKKWPFKRGVRLWEVKKCSACMKLGT